MGFSWWNSEMWWRSPALWTAAGVLFYLAGILAEPTISKRFPKKPDIWPIVREVFVAAYCVGPAFVGIPLAVLFPSALGVESSVWLPRFFEGLGAFAALFLTLLAFVLISRRGNKGSHRSYPWWAGIREGIYAQSHWGLYRGLVAAAGIGIYAATWLGALIGVAEWVVAGLLSGFPNRRESAIRLGILTATAALFVYSQNLWLCMVFHWLAAWVLENEWA